MSFIVLTEQTIDPAPPESGKAIEYFMNTGTIRLQRADGSIYEFLLQGSDYLDLVEQGSDPASPASGRARIFPDGSGGFKAKLPDGSVSNVGGSAALVDFNYSLAGTPADSAHDFSYTAADELNKIGANSYWQADLTGGSQWASIDLGSSVRIDKIVVKHYIGPFDSDPTLATSEFKIQWSNDNSAWTDYNHITGNVDQISTFTSVGLTHRYWRILVIVGESDTSPGVARIKRLELIQTNQATMYIDGDGSSYVILPDSSKYYIKHVDYITLLGTDYASAFPTPPVGVGLLGVGPDGVTVYLKDSNGVGHAVMFRGIPLFIQTNTVTNTNNTEDALIGSGTGSVTYAAAALNVTGYTVRQKMKGVLSSISSSAGTLTINVYMGATLIGSTGAIALPTSLTNADFELEVDSTIRVTGASGQIMTLGSFDIISGGVRTSYGVYNQSGAATPIIVDLTGSIVLSDTSTFSVGGTGNSISSLQLAAEVLNQ